MLYQLSYFRSLRLLRRAALTLLAAVAGAEGQNRTDDTSIFSAVLYLLSYLGDKNILIIARRSVKFKARMIFSLFSVLSGMGIMASNHTAASMNFLHLSSDLECKLGCSLMNAYIFEHWRGVSICCVIAMVYHFSQHNLVLAQRRETLSL